MNLRYHFIPSLDSLHIVTASLLLPVVILSTMDQEPLQPVKKKRGRPKGSRDKPRQPGDKPRGRPRKAPKPAQAARADAAAANVDGRSSGSQFSISY